MVFIVIVIGILLALVVGALLLVPLLVDEDAILKLAQDAVREETGGELRVDGPIDIGFFPRLEVQLGDAAIELPARSDNHPAIAASVRHLDIGLAVVPLLSGATQVDGLVLEGVAVTVRQGKQAPQPVSAPSELSDSDWERLGRRQRAEREAARQALLQDAGTTAVVIVLVESVRLDDVVVDIQTHEGVSENRFVLERLMLTDVNTSARPIGLEATLIVGAESEGAITVDLAGTARIDDQLSQIDLDRLETAVSGALAEPITSVFKGVIALSPLRADVAFDSSLSAGQLAGKLTYAALESPQSRLVINSERLNLDALEPAGATDQQKAPPSAGGGSGQASAAPAAKPPPLPLPVGPLRNLDLEMTLAADELVTGGQTIEAANLDLTVRDGIARINTLRGVLHQGQLEATAQINVRRAQVRASTEGTIEDVALDSLLTSLGDPGLATGTALMSWDLKTQGSTVEDLTVGLEGDLDFTGDDVVLESVSVQKAMCQAAATLNQKSLTGSMPTNTPLSALRLAVDFDAGVADIDDLTLAMQGVALTGRGSAQLNSLDFQLALQGKLDNALASLDPNCAIEDRYARLDWPVVCSGNLTGEPQDWCRVNTDSLIEQLVRDEARSQIEKNADKLGESASKFLKKLLGD